MMRAAGPAGTACEEWRPPGATAGGWVGACHDDHWDVTQIRTIGDLLEDRFSTEPRQMQVEDDDVGN